MQDERSGELLARWQAGEQQAAAELFRRYADRLIALAQSRLPARLAPRVDAEDVVQSVYRSFFAGASEGRYDLQRGGDLWRLLVTITLHKVYRQVARNARGKRAVQREQSFGAEDELLGQAPLLARDPSPVEVVALVDELEQIMRGLKPQYRRMLELRLQGHDIFTIATQTQSGERTVRRVLEQVKQQLQERRREDGAS
jgi:RNA polymerase sigma-70 factor (ECF subfamily)